MSQSDDDVVPLMTLADRFVLVQRLAADDRHETWRGHDDLAGREVAVTRYFGADDAWLAAFDRRARQLEAIADPGIASVLAHDVSDDPPWLAAAYVEGETVTAILLDRGLATDDALAVIGQTAMALAAAHGSGIAHGRLDGDHIQVRSDGSVALFGFAMPAPPAVADDLAALARLAHELLDRSAADGSDVADLLRLLDAGDWTDVADVGRTTLALAAAARAGSGLPMRPALTPAEPDDEAAQPRRPWYDEAERKRVRNRLIALAAIVVLGGVVLLRIVGAGAGQTAVPSVVGISFEEAQHDLNEDGLRANETITTGRPGTDGTVIAQDPPAGQRVKVGSVVQLTVVALGSG
ncbi:MAG TPA: PASTA domain-containing protein [Mycobacteriales bacterium]|nr:PASTA domain-containing protein [Mycobacteriales bacterium]